MRFKVLAPLELKTNGAIREFSKGYILELSQKQAIKVFEIAYNKLDPIFEDEIEDFDINDCQITIFSKILNEKIILVFNEEARDKVNSDLPVYITREVYNLAKLSAAPHTAVHHRSPK
jgi:hypothetical protein